MNRQTKLFTVTLAALSVVACSDPASSDEEQVSKVIIDVNNELVSCLGNAECDPSVFDEYATGTARENLDGVVTGMFGATVDADIEVTVSKVVVAGDSATAEACNVITINGMAQNGEPIDAAQIGDLETWVTQSYELVKADGTWKVSGNDELDNGSVEDGINPCAP